MSLTNVYISIVIIAVVTFFTRVFPFLFYGHKEPPQVILFVGKYIPPVIITILVIYCLKDIEFYILPYGLNEIIAVLLVFLLHRWGRNPLISIFGSTLAYMFLTQTAVIQKIM